MECNKDEALKAKELSEKKFKEKDLMGARKFAMKAQTLCPDLDGLQSLVETLNIYVSAERKVNGEVDWYGVLGVDPSSDDDIVKKQYRKLALTLHPDKNKSVGAEGAFKILSEAWSLLSDKAKRIAYDQKRNSRKVFEKVIPTKPSKPGVVRQSVDRSNSNMKSQNVPNPHLSNSVHPPPKRETFWTMCTNCKMQFEYLLFYLNKKLECYHCKKPYLAIRIPPPHTNIHPPWATQSPQDASNLHSGTQAMNGTQSKNLHEASQMNAALKRSHTSEANGSLSTVKGEKPKRRRRANEPNGVTPNTNPILKGNTTYNNTGSSNGLPNGFTETEKVTLSGSKLSPIPRELSILETRNMLIAKAKSVISQKLNELKSTDLKAKASNKETGFKDKATINEKLSASNLKADENQNKSSSSDRKPYSKVIEHVPSSMIVPDPDFHDFDKDRTEKSFGDNQVWAAYDDDDGMPRYYAMIHNVISRKPFKMRISWLNSKNTSEFGSLNWVGCGFFKTSGDFRVGKHEINKSVNSFSHRVKWTKGTRGAIRIYPRKGDIWALFKNWSPKWNEHTPDTEVHQYEMVEVIDDYNEEKGATIIPLVKVNGFKTVFDKHKDEEQVKVIPREEMFRFSHQVPAFLLTGEEGANSPKGCWELDPAASPIELITETSNETRKENVDIANLK